MKPSKQPSMIALTLSNLYSLHQQIFRGASLYRALTHLSLSLPQLSGSIIDLGSGSQRPSYSPYLQLKQPYQITYTDFFKSSRRVKKINLEKPFPLPANSYDYVLCINVIEHVFNYDNLISQAYHILKPQGTFIGVTPFVFFYHPSPHDYYRFTSEAIITIFKRHHFHLQHITYLGFGPLCAGYMQIMFLIPQFLRPVFFLPSLIFDLLIHRFSAYFRFKYPLGFMYIFQKKSSHQ